MNYQDYLHEEATLLSLLYRDGEPSPVAKEMHTMAHNMLTEKYRALKESKEAAAGDKILTGKDAGKPKKRVKNEMQIVMVAVGLLVCEDFGGDKEDDPYFTLLEEEDWEKMRVELPTTLKKDWNLKPDAKTLKRILKDRHRDIERLALAKVKERNKSYWKKKNNL